MNTTLEERKQTIEEMNEEYYQETGDFLPNFILEMFGTWLLQEVYGFCHGISERER